MKPRLADHGDPYYSTGAKDAFLEVLIRAGDVQRPGRIGTGYTNPATELGKAVEVASLWCNPELLRRMNDFKDVILDQSRGEGSDEKAFAAQQFFTSGCRQALGTND